MAKLRCWAFGHKWEWDGTMTFDSTDRGWCYRADHDYQQCARCGRCRRVCHGIFKVGDKVVITDEEAVKLEAEDLQILIAHWRNEEGTYSWFDDEYAFHCRAKARKFEKALDALEKEEYP